MKTLKVTSQFKKDLKRYRNSPKSIADLEEVLHLLSATGSVPENYRPHMLLGDYKGFMECHVGNDFLLIWFDETNDIIKLVRLGSHAELF